MLILKLYPWCVSITFFQNYTQRKGRKGRRSTHFSLKVMFYFQKYL